MIFIADFIVCSTCLRQYYAHHQELESIIQMVAACGIWCCNKYHLLHLVGILFPHNDQTVFISEKFGMLCSNIYVSSYLCFVLLCL